MIDLLTCEYFYIENYKSRLDKDYLTEANTNKIKKNFLLSKFINIIKYSNLVMKNFQKKNIMLFFEKNNKIFLLVNNKIYIINRR